MSKKYRLFLLNLYCDLKFVHKMMEIIHYFYDMLTVINQLEV